MGRQGQQFRRAVAPLTYFNQSNIYCTFQSNSVCFNPAVVPIQDRALGFFPYNTWGGRIKVAPTKSFYAQVGIFEANTSLIPTNGFDWSTKGSTGHQTAVEIGLQSAIRKPGISIICGSAPMATRPT